MAQSDMKQPSNRTIFAAVAGLVAGVLSYGWWHSGLLTALLVTIVVFILLWWLLGQLWADAAPADSGAAIPAPEPMPAPTPMPPQIVPAHTPPPAPLVETVAPATAVMQAPVPDIVPTSARKPRVAAKPLAAPVTATPVAKPKVAPKAKAAKPDGPLRLSAPRKGKADDLKEIEGIGPALEKLCNELGFYHFDQIAGWSDADVAWVDANMKTFKGRVVRDKWIAQSKIILAEGLEAFRVRAKTNDY